VPVTRGIRKLGRLSLWGASAGPLLHPARILVAAFGAAVVIGTGLLSLPAATASGQQTHTVDALFTSTSAVCLTGLLTVDTATHWSTFGEVVIMVLIQLGGLGIMTVATLFALLLSGRLGLRARLLAQAETKTLRLQDVRRVLRRVLVFSAVSELVVAVVLTFRFALAYDYSLGRAIYHGVFFAISSFNNAGFSLYSDSLMQFVADPWVNLSISIAVIVGSLGFPVVFELTRSWRRPGRWSVLTRITVTVTVALLAIGTLIFTLTELNNPKTFGPLSGWGRLMAGFFAAVQPRSGGFNTVDIGAMTPESLLVTDILMFIGGGSASTGGGIKVTTFGLLAFVIWAEARGERRVNVGTRHVPESNQRQAVAVALLGIGLVATFTFVLMTMTRDSFDRMLFEVVSAFGTAGLSTGITADMPRAAHVLLAILMFMGRIGPLTVASALALKDRGRRFEYPEERTIVG
jgi:trk system potassium uptake protein